MSHETNSVPPGSHAKPPKRRFLAGLLTGSILGGALALGASVFAHGPEGGWIGARCMGRGAHGPVSPAVLRTRMEFAVDWMAAKVNATEMQKTRIKALLAASLDDMLVLREPHVANRNAMVASLAGETVDRAALDTARRAELELVERASERLARTAADIAEVLTPEQRRGVLELLGRFMGPAPLASLTDRPPRPAPL